MGIYKKVVLKSVSFKKMVAKYFAIFSHNKIASISLIVPIPRRCWHHTKCYCRK